MKPAFLLMATILMATMIFSISAVSQPRDHAQPAPANPSQNSQSILNSETLIEAGEHVGSLKLGDSQERALQLFPKKYEDSQWDDPCGTTLGWADTENKIRGGNLFIRVKKGKVFQIESATTRFQTIEGITTLDPPEKVASAYKDLHAFTLLTPPVAALGDRPLVFWVDKKKGIAFAFAFYPKEQKRYLYKIIVFLPNKTFCPEQETTGSPKWQGIPAYSLEPPRDLAQNRERKAGTRKEESLDHPTGN